MKAFIAGKKLGIEKKERMYEGQKKVAHIVHILDGYDSIPVKVPEDLLNEVGEVPDGDDIMLHVELNVFKNEIYPVADGVVEQPVMAS